MVAVAGFLDYLGSADDASEPVTGGSQKNAVFNA